MFNESHLNIDVNKEREEKMYVLPIRGQFVEAAQFFDNNLIGDSLCETEARESERENEA